MWDKKEMIKLTTLSGLSDFSTLLVALYMEKEMIIRFTIACILYLYVFALFLDARCFPSRWS